MAIAFAAAATVINTTPGTTMTIDKPVGTSAGDLLVAALTWTSGVVAVSAAPAGWSSIRLTTSGGVNQISVHTYYKYASAGEGTSWTWNLDGGGIQNCGAVWRVTGAHSASAVETSAGNVGQGSAISATALTNSYNDALICFFAGASMDRAGVSFTTPSAYAQNTTLLAGASNMAGFTRAQPGAGSTGNVVTSVGAADAADYWAAQLVSLRPTDPTVEDRALGNTYLPMQMQQFSRRRWPISYTAFLNKDEDPSTLVDAALIQRTELTRRHLNQSLRLRPRQSTFFHAAPLSADLTTPPAPPHTDTAQVPPRGGILPPNPMSNEEQWMRQASSWMLEANQGHLNNTGIITLAANVSSTLVLDERVGPNSHIGFMARTANAAAELGNGTMYVSTQDNGRFVITHAFSAQSDRTFVYSILG